MSATADSQPSDGLGRSIVEPRIESLTGLRCWAAFGVFLYHMGNLAPLPIAEALHFGNYGVMFFFILSGFVLTWSARPGVAVSTFYWRRFARIYPAHVVALVVAIPVFYSMAPDPAQAWVKPLDLAVLLLSVLLIQGWWRDPVILFSGNPAAWTLTVEAFFYALHPALSRILRAVGSRGALLIALGIVAGAFGWRLLGVVALDLVTLVPLPVARLSEFALGMCLAHAMRLGWRPRVHPWAPVALGAVLLVVLTADGVTDWMGPARTLIRGSAPEWIMLFCAALIIAVAARDLAGRRSLLRHRWLVRLGEASYAFYLVHATVIYIVLGIVGPQSGGWSALIWYPPLFVGALVAAFALHLGVEKPLERRLRRWGETRAARHRVDDNPPAVRS